MSDQRYLPEVLFENGFTDLISVVPPGATISPGSKLQPSQLGKVPGRRNRNGTWAGYDWLKAQHSVDDVRQWMKDGANVGLRATHFPGLDIDSENPTIAEFVEAYAIAVLGDAPVRFGRRPKRLLMYATNEPFGRLRVWATKGEIHTDGYEQHLVEILGDGQQYLVYGTHPSGANYEWMQDMSVTLADSLTIITKEQAIEFRDCLGKQFAEWGYDVSYEGDGKPPSAASVEQKALLAPSPEAVFDAMACLPNDGPFDERKAWLDVGYALKASLGVEHEHEARELFLEWSLKWHHPSKGADFILEEFRRLVPPYRIGWPWLQETAREHGYDTSTMDFEPLDALPIAPDEIPEPPAEEDDPAAAPKWSDFWLADQIAKKHSDRLRFASENEMWYFWTGKMWEPDTGAHLTLQLIKEELQALANIRKASGAEKAIKEAKAIAGQGTKVRVEALMRHAPGIAISLKSFDADPWLLNTPDGMIDLRTGMKLPPDPAALCSKTTAVAPDFGGPCPEWRRFLAETTKDRDLEAYLQRYAGYCLTGVTYEQQFSIWHGPGGNGKGTTQRAITNVMGSYAGTADISIFVETSMPQHSTGVAALAGLRFVASSEADKKQKLSAARLKQFSGEDNVTARFMRQDNFTYTPQFKLALLMNPMPILHDTSEAMRRRLHFVPFLEKPDVVDAQLGDKLKEEWPAILAWMIEGCLLWQKEGLNPPERVRATTEEYFENEDHMGRWLKQRTETTQNKSDQVRMEEMWKRYNEWASLHGLTTYRMSHTFAKELKSYPLSFGKNADMQSVVRCIRFKPEESSVTAADLEALP